MPLLPAHFHFPMFDAFLCEGHKILFRYGLGLIRSCKQPLKTTPFEDGDAWWACMAASTREDSFNPTELRAACFGQKPTGRFSITGRAAPLRRKRIAQLIEAAEAAQYGGGAVAFDARPTGSATVFSRPMALDSRRGHLAELLAPVERRDFLRGALPARLQEDALNLMYTTEADGRGLERLYAKCRGADRGSLLVATDLTRERVFGAFVTGPWRPGPGDLGSGECFVFQLEPRPAVYKWLPSDAAPDGSFFACNDAFAAVGLAGSEGEGEGGGGGGGGGECALRIAADFDVGFSGATALFGNPPLCKPKDFKLGAVEVYSFVLPQALVVKTVAF